MQELVQLDQSLFRLINQSWTHPAFDVFFPVWTDFHKTTAFALFLLPALLAWAYWRLRGLGLLFIAMALTAVGISDGLFGKLMKPAFARPRPPVAGIETILRAPHYGGYSFPSNHAANMFCLAFFTGVFFPRLRIPLILMAGITAYSRVYCGVHYPSDVLGGALMGSLLGWGLARLWKPWWIRLKMRTSSKEA